MSEAKIQVHTVMVKILDEKEERQMEQARFQKNARDNCSKCKRQLSYK
jgi:hypothetical protein